MSTGKPAGFIFAVLNRKGGAGKTTTALNIAVVLAQRGVNVVVLDADPQHSSDKWSGDRSEQSPDAVHVPVFVKASSKDKPIPLAREVASLAKGYDVVIIDGPAKTSTVEAEALKVADAILVPVQPTKTDLNAVEDTVDLIRERHILTDGVPPAVFVVKRAKPNTVLGREIDDRLLEFGLPVLGTRLHDYQAYANAADVGLSVVELEPRSTAAQETIALVDELIANDLLKVPT